MHSPKSPKSQKLLQFRDKLSKLNGHSVLNNQRQRQRIAQIITRNKIVEADLSAIFNQLNQFYNKLQKSVITSSQSICQYVQNNKNALLDKLQQVKQVQLQTIQGDVDYYISFQKKIKKLSIQLENNRGKIDPFFEQISKIKAFSTTSIHTKIDQYRSNRQDIQNLILNFCGLQQIFKNAIKNAMGNNQQIYDKNKQYSHNLFQCQSQQSFQSKQGNRQAVISHKKINYFDQNHKYKYNGNLLNLEMANKYEKTERQQQNLMLVDSSPKSKKNNNQLIKNLNHSNSRSDQEQIQGSRQIQGQRQIQRQMQIQIQRQIDQKTQKLKSSLMKIDMKQLSRKQSHQTIPEMQLKHNVNKFVYELRRESRKCNQDQVSNQISSRDEVSIAVQKSKNKHSKISRVKSQQNLSSNKYKNGSQNMQLKFESPKLNSNQAIPSVLSIDTSQRGLKQSKTGRRGEWASILKQQQLRYNEMRKKIKD